MASVLLPPLLVAPVKTQRSCTISSSRASNASDYGTRESLIVPLIPRNTAWESSSSQYEAFGTPFVACKSRNRDFRVLRAIPGGNDPSFPVSADDTVELPLFPLPLVLFPGTILPLQIFEYRYRIMMHTLLQTDMRFGVVFSGRGNGTAAAIGCVGEIARYERLPDDRFFLICRGEERFRVTEIVRRRPYLVGRVRWLEDRPSADDVAEGPDALADEVANIMRDVIRLSGKMSGKTEEAPEDLRKAAFPTPFSFWVASTFEGAPAEQQALLELEDTAERLRRERETLRNTLNYLTAAAAVKDAFASDK